MGCAWADYVPKRTFTLFGHRWELNPGPFNVKEHTIITLMTAAGSAVSYTIDILLAQELFYQQHFKWGFQILLMVSTQAMGLGVAGICRRFLIWPAAMVWPAVLITTVVMYSLHDHRPSDPAITNGWSIGRYAFFLIVSLGTFFYEWIPQVIAPFLQLFMVPCWMAPNNVLMNQLFGGQSGLGLMPISFDWSVISGFLGSPLQTPAFAIANVGAGIFIMLIGVIGLTWAGPEFYRYLPISANQNFDNMAQPYNTSYILKPDFTINQTAYEDYSPVLLGSAFSLSYGMGFASLISTVTHVALFYGQDVWQRARSSRYDEPDIHLKLMRKYREVPEWWFQTIFVASFSFGMIAAVVWATHLPWWAYIVAVALGTIFIVPIGIVQAVTNQQPGLNIFTELICGYMLPGRPVALMLFKSWGYMTCSNALSYLSDMKVSREGRVKPRYVVHLLTRLPETVWSLYEDSPTVYLCCPVLCRHLALHSPGYSIQFPARQHQGNLYRGPGSGAHLSRCAHILQRLGDLGSHRAGQGLRCGTTVRLGELVLAYRFRLPCAAVRGSAALSAQLDSLPLLTSPVRRSWHDPARYDVVFGSVCHCGPSIQLVYTSQVQWLVVYVFLFLPIAPVTRLLTSAAHYNYTLSGALDIGTALCVVVVGLALGLSETSFPSWWGVTVVSDNLDATSSAVSRHIQPGAGPIGPKSW